MADTNTNAARTAFEEHTFKILGGSALLLLVLGTVVYQWLEDWSWVDSLYFSTVAVTTVGFGDLTPTSDSSKLFTVVYILSGITLITAYLNARFKRHAERRSGRHRDRRSGGTST